MSGVYPNKMKHPQLFGASRAARQACRAAGVVGDTGPDPFTGAQHPIVAATSIRKFMRRMARLKGVPARRLSEVCAELRRRRIAALGRLYHEAQQREREAHRIRDVRQRRFRRLLRRLLGRR